MSSEFKTSLFKRKLKDKPQSGRKYISDKGLSKIPREQ
jgi:hypothetical protein